MLLTLSDIHSQITRVEELHAYTGLLLATSYTQTFSFVDRLGNQGNYPYAQIKEAQRPDGQRLRIYEIALPLKADANLVSRRPWLHTSEIELSAAFPNAWKNANL